MKTGHPLPNLPTKTIFIILFGLFYSPIASSSPLPPFQNLKIHLSRSSAPSNKDTLTHLENTPNKPQSEVQQSLINGNNLQYYGSIQMGTGTTPYKVLFDTGSDALWLGSKSTEFGSSHIPFTCLSTSKTCSQNSTFAVTLQYGMGSLKAKIDTDTLTICNQKIQKFNFLEATEIQNLQNLDSDGVFGLGYNKLQYVSNLIFLMKDQDLIPKKQFTLDLNPSLKANSSSIQFGGVDSHFINKTSPMDTQIMWSVVPPNKNYWEIEITMISFGDIVMQMDTGTTALIDSGSSLITVPKRVAEGYINYTSSRR